MGASADLSCFRGFDLCSDLDCPYADDPTCRSCNGIAEPGLCGITYAKGDTVVKQTCKIQSFSGLCPVICDTCKDEDRTTKTLTATTTLTTSTLTSTTATKTTTTST